MKRKFGDRKDATLVRKTDAIHLMMPLIWPSRCDSTFLTSQVLDLTKTVAYLDKMNANVSDHKYTIFHIVVAAVLVIRLGMIMENETDYQKAVLSQQAYSSKIIPANSITCQKLLSTW